LLGLWCFRPRGKLVDAGGRGLDLRCWEKGDVVKFEGKRVGKKW